MIYTDYTHCINSCANCASLSEYCASMCLKDKTGLPLSFCVQLSMECATICSAAARLMSLESEFAPSVCKVCAEMCIKCADECSKYDTAFCYECAEACRQCAGLCKKMYTVESIHGNQLFC